MVTGNTKWVIVNVDLFFKNKEEEEEEMFVNMNNCCHKNVKNRLQTSGRTHVNCVVDIIIIIIRSF